MCLLVVTPCAAGEWERSLAVKKKPKRCTEIEIACCHATRVLFARLTCTNRGYACIWIAHPHTYTHTHTYPFSEYTIAYTSIACTQKPPPARKGEAHARNAPQLATLTVNLNFLSHLTWSLSLSLYLTLFLSSTQQAIYELFNCCCFCLLPSTHMCSPQYQCVYYICE